MDLLFYDWLLGALDGASPEMAMAARCFSGCSRRSMYPLPWAVGSKPNGPNSNALVRAVKAHPLNCSTNPPRARAPPPAAHQSKATPPGTSLWILLASSSLVGFKVLYGEACLLPRRLRDSPPTLRRHAVHRGARPRRRARHHGAGARRRAQLLRGLHGGLHLPPLPRPWPRCARQPRTGSLSTPILSSGRHLFEQMPAWLVRRAVAHRRRRSLVCCVQEKLYGKGITVADREMVEERVDQVLLEAADADVAFLVVGDPFG